jgi:hypothetical protein
MLLPIGCGTFSTYCSAISVDCVNGTARILDGSTGFVASCGSYAADEMAKRQLEARKSLLGFMVTNKNVGDIYI